MNTVGISSNALFGNSANYCFEPLNSLDVNRLSTFDLLCWLGYHFVFVCAKITLNADAQCADVNIGGRKYALRCVIGNVGDGNF